MTTETRRCGFVAVLGAPNVGKSTLTNSLVGAKVSIVSPKVQTTRARVTAIAMAGQTQLIFVDTPGIFERPKQRLERAMVAAAWGGIEDAEFLLFMLDCERGRDRDSAAILDRLQNTTATMVLVLNKIDLINRAQLLALSAKLNKSGRFAATFMISAHSGDGVGDLKAYLAAAAPEGPWHYPADQLADMPERLLAAEVTREKIFHQLHQELPYAITVETESWKQQKDGSLRIEQVVYVRRPTQKAIVLGHGGRRIKQIGQEARLDLEEMLETKVHLFLFVKVRQNWTDDPERYREMGLDYQP